MKRCIEIPLNTVFQYTDNRGKRSILILTRAHYFFFSISIYLALVILMAALGGITLFSLPGAFLFERFHLASLYLPSLVFTGGMLLKSGRLSRKTGIVLWLSPWIFLTLAIALQLTAGQSSILVIAVLMEVLGRFPATALFYFLFILEVIGIVKLITINRASESAPFSFAVLRLKLLDILALMGLLEPEGRFSSDEVEPLPTRERDQVSEPITPPVEPFLSRVFEEDEEEIIHEEASVSSVTPEPKQAAFWDDPPSYPAQDNGSAKILPEEVNPWSSGGYLDMPGPFMTEDAATKPRKQSESGEMFQQGNRVYEVPTQGILEDYPDSDFGRIDAFTRRGAEILEQTLNEFRIEARVTGICKGPVITMYELLPSHGVKISSIVNLQDNIALRLAASRVRIVAPIPGKHAIGVEVPNKKVSIVSFSSLVKADEFRNSDAVIPLILGKDISGGNQVVDLTKTPHLLIAGATGSGKSVCVNSLISSILYSRSHHKVKMIMVDPKIVELKLYNDIPHLLTPVITEPKRALQALQWCLLEMERRYSLLDSQGVRDMSSFNRRIKDRKLATRELPYIVVIIDEFADLMATSGKELEGIVARLAAMSRAVGIHLVLATQRPSVDVITGLIKANFPSRIAFMVAGRTDSRIIIDTGGAEKLLGRGDMLFTSAWNPIPFRMQGAYLSEDEVERLVDYVKTLGEPEYIDEEIFTIDDSEEFRLESDDGEDPMYNKALEIVMSSRKVSASYLQRCLKIGYNRAARLVEEMESRGIVGPANGSKPRDIISVPDENF